LYAKLKKFEFWLAKVTFLGHVVTKEGIKVDPEKVKVVVEWPRPNDRSKNFSQFSRVL